MLGPFAQIAVIFVILCVGASIGMVAQRFQPIHHRDDATKETVKLVMGLMATLTALILSLLIASAHGLYDTQRQEIQQLADDVLLLDTNLAHYGPEAEGAREQLRNAMQVLLKSMTPHSEIGMAEHGTAISSGVSGLLMVLDGLKPATDVQRQALASSQTLLSDIASMRLVIHQQATMQPPKILTLTLLFWLALLFLFFGLFAPLNLTSVGFIFVGMVSVTAAMFLMLSMSRPYAGSMRIPDVPLRNAVAQIGQ